MAAVAYPSASTLVHLPPTPSHSPLVEAKRLRSCLSPTRRYPSNPIDTAGLAFSQSSTINSNQEHDDLPPLTMSSAASTPMTSRSASFSSTCDESANHGHGVGAGWRRVKSVHWNQGDQEASSTSISVYSTWSADDYDRSPLEPPKPEERACILPARNSRCLSTVSCFLEINTNVPGAGGIPHLDLQDSPIKYLNRSHSPSSDDDAESSNDEEDEGDSAENAEQDDWEKTMNDRRILMFAQRMQLGGGNALPSVFQTNSESAPSSASIPIPITIPNGACTRPLIEGYTSLTASLADMFTGSGMSMEARDVSTPVGSPVEHEAEVAFGRSMGMGSEGEGACADRQRERGRPRLIRRVNGSFNSVIDEAVQEEDEEEEQSGHEGQGYHDEDDDDDDVPQPSLETVMAALRAYRSGNNPILGTGDEQRDT